MEKLLILDTNSLLNRAYYAIRGLTTQDGMPTGAIFGTLKLILDISAKVQPDRIFAAFDIKKKNFRHDIFPEYKGHRKPMDEELAVQLEPLKEILRLMGIAIVQKEGFEADDIIGTLTQTLVGEKTVVSGDKDLLQLIKDDTTVYLTKVGVSQLDKNDIKVLNEKGFRTVDEFVDYKGLRGDTSDNIPGVEGIGELTALKLIKEYGSIDNIYKNIETVDVSNRVRENLKRCKDICYMSKQLATIVKDVSLDIHPEDGKYNFDSQEVISKLKEFELISIVNMLVKKEEIKFDIVNVSDEEALTNIFKNNGGKVSIAISGEITFAFDKNKLYSIRQKELLFDEGFYFEDAVRILIKACADRKILIFDSKKVQREYDLNFDCFDTKIAMHLAQYSKEIGNADEAFKNLYAMEYNAVTQLYIYDKICDALNRSEQMKIYTDIEYPLSKVLLDMERTGICVSSEKLVVLDTLYADKLNVLTEKIHELTGSKFNISSPKQMSEVLFDKLGLPAIRKNKNGYSVDEEVLVSLKDKHPAIEYILQYRKYSKLLSTYVRGIQGEVHGGKIHTIFNQCITATGRLSSSNPNMQNIPMRGEDAQEIKSAFVAEEGTVLISADYSQIELRVLAHLSKDPIMIKAFKDNMDIHAATAAEIFGVNISQVTPTQRKNAKAINFGIIYGISSFGLSESANISQKEAKGFIETYFERYSVVKEYLDKLIEEARAKGYIQTYFGRKRRSGDINSSNKIIRSQAERIAMNTPIQGTAAEIMKIAMLKVYEALKGYKAKILIQIHDELIVQVPTSEIDKVKDIIKNSMEDAVKLDVPLKVSMDEGKNWGEL